MIGRTGQTLLAILTGVLLLVLNVQVGASMSGRYLPPNVILTLAPNDSRALAREAEAMQKAGALSAAASLVRKSLAEDPNQIVAIRTAALIAAQRNNAVGAGRLFDYAERLTRRDLPTEIWFIESSVAANNIRRALYHYDVALRASSGAGTLLLPILAHAVDEPQITNELADLLVAAPFWSEGFFQTLIGTDVPPATIANFMSVALKRGVRVPELTKQGAIRNIAAAGRPDLAWQLFKQGWHGEMPLLRNSQFRSADQPIPFEWQYSSGDDLSAERDMDEEGWALLVRARPGVSGQVATQDLVLAPGRYSVRTNVVSGDPAMHLAWGMTCAGLQKIAAVIPANAAGGAFVVPANDCGLVRMTLQVAHNGDAAGESRIGSVVLRPTS